ncbi:MAG: peptidyl-prolyl cis-trans isomerase [Actinomycetota bacterium]
MRMGSKKLLIPLVIVLVAGASLLAVRGRSASPVASVNGEALSESELSARMSEAQGRLAGMPNSSPARRQVLLEMIRFEVMRQEAERLGISPPTTDAAIAAAKSSMGTKKMDEAMEHFGWDKGAFTERWQEKALMVELVERFGGDPLTEAELKGYYQRYKHLFSHPRQASVRVAVFASEAKAQDAAGRVRNGESFAEVAKDSTDKHSAQSGGALGWIDVEKLPAEIKAELKTAKPGQLLGPLKGDHGTMLYVYDGMRPAEVEPYAKVREDLRPWAEKAEKTKRVITWLNGLLDKADIRIDPETGTWVKSERTIAASGAPHAVPSPTTTSTAAVTPR